MTRAIIFANGDLPNIRIAQDLLQPDDFLIGVDGGTVHIFNMGLRPNVVVGDMDSIPEEILSRLTASDVEINLHPADKNETDLELALDYAIRSAHREILILAAMGGRLDHALSNLLLLTHPRLQDLKIRIDDGMEELFFCRDQVHVHGRPGDLVSLIPWGGQVTGIATNHLKWPLRGETLVPYKTRGVSNQMLAEAASIKIASGLLLIIHRRIN